LDLASQSNVQDAFVIAVEQQARDRLEKLSALKRIKPVDMTKLSQQVNYFKYNMRFLIMGAVHLTRFRKPSQKPIPNLFKAVFVQHVRNAVCSQMIRFLELNPLH